jgi:hypothetical protein
MKPKLLLVMITMMLAMMMMMMVVVVVMMMAMLLLLKRLLGARAAWPAQPKVHVGHSLHTENRARRRKRRANHR